MALPEREEWEVNMDSAAQAAQAELNKLPQDAVKKVAEWWAKFYLKAGHKRLGRALVKAAGVTDETA